MKLKVLRFIAEYFVFVEAGVAMILVVGQGSMYDGVKMLTDSCLWPATTEDTGLYSDISI
jgi:hypothetical protein